MKYQELSFLTYFPLLSLIFILALGFFVLLKNKQSILHRLFFLISIAFSMWMLGTFMMFISTTDEQIIFWDRFVYLGVVFMPALQYHFSLISTYINRQRKILFFVAYSLSIIFLFLSRTKYFVNNVFYYSWGVHTEAKIFHHFFLIFFFFYIFALLYNFIIQYRRTDNKTEKVKLKYLIISFVILNLFGGIGYLPAYRISIFSPISLLAPLFFSIFTAYSIIKHRFLGIKVIASNIYLYILLTFFSFAFYHFTYFVIKNYFISAYNAVAIIFGVLAALVFSILFLPFINYIQRSGDSLFYSGRKPKRMVKEIAILMKEKNSMIELRQFLNKELTKMLDASSITILSKKESLASSLSGVEVITNICNSKREIVIKSELGENSQRWKALNEMGANIIVPLFYNDCCLGVVLLGDKISKEAYTKEEIDFLEDLAPHIAATLFNVLEIEKLRRENASMKEAQKDFLHIISDKIRTPIYKIKSLFGLLERNETDVQQRQNYLASLADRTANLGELLDNAVIAAKIDSQALEFDFLPISLNKLLLDIIDNKKREALKKSISLNYNFVRQDIKSLSNRSFLETALDNIIDNAIKFSLGGNVNINLSVTDKKAIIKIEDTGIGISEEDKDKLFDKFQKAGNYQLAYKKGLGLGLYVAKNIIELHEDGKIYLRESELDKGSVFIIELPLFLEID